MPARSLIRSHWRLSISLLLVCATLTAFLWLTRGWIWLGVPPIDPDRPAFSDTYAHLSTAVNCADGLRE